MTAVEHPGVFLLDELQARGWKQVSFARMIGRPPQAVNEIIRGKKRITAETAVQISQALDTSPQLWLNLQSAYDLAQAQRP